MKILFTGGGTAGHIFPIIAIVREIRENYPSGVFEFFYLGPKDKFVNPLFSQEKIEIRTILAGKIRRYFSFTNIIDVLFKLPVGIIQAFYHIFVISPDLIFSKGGYGSMSAIFAGWILQVPIFSHESDTAPGLANKLASKFALEIFTSFPVEKTEYFPAKKMIAVGNPIRKELIKGPGEEAKKLFGLRGGKPLIVILGGSQGAQRINDVLLVVLAEALQNFEIIHQTGEANFEQVKKEIDIILTRDLKEYYHLFPFLNEQELSAALRKADLIISRAGAGSIFEIAALEKPSILVPLPEAAQNHQVKNAYTFAENGAALVIEDENFKPHFLLGKIKYLFTQPETLKEMSAAAKEFSKPQAARIVAEYIATYLIQ